MFFNGKLHLLVEKPDFASGPNLRAVIDNRLRLNYGLDFNSIQKFFTVVTDGAANMARMANSSISSRLVCRDEKWIGYFVHVLSNCMKSLFQRCGEDSVSARVSNNLRAVQRIVEDSKHFE